MLSECSLLEQSRPVLVATTVMEPAPEPRNVGPASADEAAPVAKPVSLPSAANALPATSSGRAGASFQRISSWPADKCKIEDTPLEQDDALISHAKNWAKIWFAKTAPDVWFGAKQKRNRKFYRELNTSFPIQVFADYVYNDQHADVVVMSNGCKSSGSWCSTSNSRGRSSPSSTSGRAEDVLVLSGARLPAAQPSSPPMCAKKDPALRIKRCEEGVYSEEKLKSLHPCSTSSTRRGGREERLYDLLTLSVFLDQHVRNLKNVNAPPPKEHVDHKNNGGQKLQAPAASTSSQEQDTSTTCSEEMNKTPLFVLSHMQSFATEVANALHEELELKPDLWNDEDRGNVGTNALPGICNASGTDCWNKIHDNIKHDREQHVVRWFLLYIFLTVSWRHGGDVKQMETGRRLLEVIFTRLEDMLERTTDHVELAYYSGGAPAPVQEPEGGLVSDRELQIKEQSNADFYLEPVKLFAIRVWEENERVLQRKKDLAFIEKALAVETFPNEEEVLEVDLLQEDSEGDIIKNPYFTTNLSDEQREKFKRILAPECASWLSSTALPDEGLVEDLRAENKKPHAHRTVPEELREIKRRWKEQASSGDEEREDDNMKIKRPRHHTEALLRELMTLPEESCLGNESCATTDIVRDITTTSCGLLTTPASNQVPVLLSFSAGVDSTACGCLLRELLDRKLSKGNQHDDLDLYASSSESGIMTAKKNPLSTTCPFTDFACLYLHYPANREEDNEVDSTADLELEWVKFVCRHVFKVKLYWFSIELKRPHAEEKMEQSDLRPAPKCSSAPSPDVELLKGKKRERRSSCESKKPVVFGLSREEYERYTRGIRFHMYRQAWKKLCGDAAHSMTNHASQVDSSMTNTHHDKMQPVVLLGHHQDDCDENRLENLTRGHYLFPEGSTGPDGMQKVRIVGDVLLYRPFVERRKRDFLNYLQQESVDQDHMYLGLPRLRPKCPYLKDSTPAWSVRGVMRKTLDRVLQLEVVEKKCCQEQNEARRGAGCQGEEQDVVMKIQAQTNTMRQLLKDYSVLSQHLAAGVTKLERKFVYFPNDQAVHQDISCVDTFLIFRLDLNELESEVENLGCKTDWNRMREVVANIAEPWNASLDRDLIADDAELEQACGGTEPDTVSSNAKIKAKGNEARSRHDVSQAGVELPATTKRTSTTAGPTATTSRCLTPDMLRIAVPGEHDVVGGAQEELQSDPSSSSSDFILYQVFERIVFRATEKLLSVASADKNKMNDHDVHVVSDPSTADKKPRPPAMKKLGHFQHFEDKKHDHNNQKARTTNPIVPSGLNKKAVRHCWENLKNAKKQISGGGLTEELGYAFYCDEAENRRELVLYCGGTIGGQQHYGGRSTSSAKDQRAKWFTRKISNTPAQQQELAKAQRKRSSSKGRVQA
ncbi:unnamed protein product [Amoebophrya sp. A120]|nr:unnamed protein product [Amoebophrya sp. A120]|eukprot:GSA120T00007200001.1